MHCPLALYNSMTLWMSQWLMSMETNSVPFPKCPHDGGATLHGSSGWCFPSPDFMARSLDSSGYEFSVCLEEECPPYFRQDPATEQCISIIPCGIEAVQKVNVKKPVLQEPTRPRAFL